MNQYIFLILLFNLFVFRTDVHGQFIQSAYQIGGLSKQQAYRSITDKKGNTYVVVNHENPFVLDSIGTNINIEADNCANLTLIKFDSNFTYQWHSVIRSFGLLKAEGSSSTLDIAVDDSGNVYFSSTISVSDSIQFLSSDFSIWYTYRTISNPYGRGIMTFFQKMSHEGAILWLNYCYIKDYSGPPSSVGFGFLRTPSIRLDTKGNLHYCINVSQNTDSLFIIDAENKQSFFKTNRESKSYLGLFTSTGKHVSINTPVTQLNNSATYTYDFQIDNNNNHYYLVKFEPQSYDTILPNTYLPNGTCNILYKTDSNFNYVWSKNIGIGSAHNPGLSLSEDANKLFYTFGYKENIFFSDTGFYINSAYPNQGALDFIISCLSKDGVWLWSQLFGGPGDDHAYSLKHKNGNLFCFGTTNSSQLPFGESSANSTTGNNAMFLTCFDSNYRNIETQSIQEVFPNYSPSSVAAQTSQISFSSNEKGYLSGWFGNTMELPCSSYTSVEGDDAVIWIINPNYKSKVDTVACSPIQSPSGKYTWDSTDTYQDTILNSTGCDSIIIVNLKVLQSKSTLDSTVCTQMVSYSSRYVWDSTGTYQDTIPNYKNCDSIITLHLTILQSKSNLDSTVCNSMVSYSGKYNWDTSGVYYDTIVNFKGCDSIISVNLKVLKTYSTIDTSNCKQIWSPSGRYVWSSSGSYYDTIPNSKGCDSLITVTYTRWIDSSSIKLSACNQLTSPSGKYVYTTNGNYTDTLLSSKGCDSILLITFTLNASNSSITRYFCDSLMSPSGKHVYRSSGQDWDTISNSLGCDSIIQLQLYHLPLITSVSSSNDISCDTPFTQLLATGGQSYLWWPAQNLSNPTISNPVARFNQEALVYVQISDTLGCLKTDSITIKVDKSETLQTLSNVFTPNNDGLNDCLKLNQITKLQSVTWQIFNRWGTLVFESSDPSDCWNGQTLGGIDAENGTYYFTLKAVSNCETPIEQHGTIMLIR